MQMRNVPAKEGSRWIADGWTLFRACPSVWIVLGIIDLVVSLILASIPLVADLTPVFTVLWAGGMAAAAEQCRTTGDVRVADAFDGIRAKFQPLFAASVFALLVTVVCDLAGGHVSNELSLLLKSYPSYQSAGVGPGVSWAALAIFVVAVVAGTMALWVAPQLIVLNGASPLDALKASFLAACRNAWPLLVYGLIVAGLAIAAVLTLGLGLLVIGPLVYLSTYAACRDMFPTAS